MKSLPMKVLASGLDQSNCLQTRENWLPAYRAADGGMLAWVDGTQKTKRFFRLVKP